MTESTVQFYCRKSVLLTGAAGFVGTVLLETILRSCPSVSKVYVLLRDKDGETAEKRKQKIFEKEIFQKLREESPELLKKIHLLVGDVTSPDLDLLPEDLESVKREVSIVFHCAAVTSPRSSLDCTILTNCVGTKHVIELCRKLRRLDVLVYTSTAYSNSHRGPEIEEKIYDLPFSSTIFLEEFCSSNNSRFQEILSGYQSNWPDAYTLSKCVTENYIRDSASDLPIAIIRPSIVTKTWRGSCPHYYEEQKTYFLLLSSAVATGFVRIMRGNKDCNLDVIPADIVANTHIVAARIAAGENLKSPLIVNCTMEYPPSLKFFATVVIKMAREKPIQGTIYKPTTLKIVNSNFLYWVLALYDHYIPALTVDVALKLEGKKMKLLSSYLTFEKVMKNITYVTGRKWKFHTRNMKWLQRQLSEDDIKVLSLDMSQYRREDAIVTPRNSSKKLDWEVQGASEEIRKKLLDKRSKRIHIIQQLFLIMLLGSICLLFSIVLRIL